MRDIKYAVCYLYQYNSFRVIFIYLKFGIVIIMSIDRCRHIVALLKQQLKTKWILVTCWVIFILSGLVLCRQTCTSYLPFLGAYDIESTAIEIIFIIAMTVTNVLIYKTLTRLNNLNDWYQQRNKSRILKIICFIDNGGFYYLIDNSIRYPENLGAVAIFLYTTILFLQVRIMLKEN